MRRGNRLTILAKAFDMKLDGLPNEIHGFLSTLADRDASRKVRDVFHLTHWPFFNPACFQMYAEDVSRASSS